MSFRVERLWAWISTANPGDDEGVIAVLDERTGIYLPLVGADEDRVRSLRPRAELAVEVSGRSAQLVRFDVRTNVETLKPRRPLS